MRPRQRRAFDRTPLRPDRLRSTAEGSFAFIPHRFLRDGFWAVLEHRELLLYLLLILVADRHGLSFYYDDRLAALLGVEVDDLLAARHALVRRDLIAFQDAGPRYQVLSLPVLACALPSQPRPMPNNRDAAEAVHIRDILHGLLAR